MANDNPFAVPDGRTRVRRNVQDAEDAANGPGPRPGAGNNDPTPADPTSNLKFSKGQQPTAAEKAKSQKGLIDAMRRRGDIASAAKDDDTDDA